MSRVRQFWIGLIGASGILSAGAGVATIGMLDWLGTSSGKEWITEEVELLASAQLREGTLELGALSTDFFTELSLTDLRVRDAQGETVLAVDSLVLRMDPYELQNERLSLTSVEVQGASMSVLIDEDGEVNILQLLPEEESEEDSIFTRMMAGWSVQVDSLSMVGADLDFEDHQPGAVLPELGAQVRELGLSLKQDASGVQLDDLTLDLVLDRPVDQDVEIQAELSLRDSSLYFRGLELAVADLELSTSGELSWGLDEPYFWATVHRLSVGPQILSEFLVYDVLSAPIVLGGQLQGRPSQLQADLSAVLPVGGLDMELEAGLSEELPSWSVRATVNQVDVAALSPLVPVELSLSGQLIADGAGWDPYGDMEASARVKMNELVIEGEELTSLEGSLGLSEGRLEVAGQASHALGTARIDGIIGLEMWDVEASVWGELPRLAVLPEVEGMPLIEGRWRFAPELGASQVGRRACAACTGR